MCLWRSSSPTFPALLKAVSVVGKCLALHPIEHWVDPTGSLRAGFSVWSPKEEKKEFLVQISCVLVCANCLLSLHWRYHCKESCSVIFMFSLWIFIYVNKTQSPFFPCLLHCVLQGVQFQLSQNLFCRSDLFLHCLFLWFTFTCSSMFMSFFFEKHEPRTGQHSRCLSSAEWKRRIIPLDLLATPSLIQPRVLSTFFASCLNSTCLSGCQVLLCKDEFQLCSP